MSSEMMKVSIEVDADVKKLQKALDKSVADVKKNMIGAVTEAFGSPISKSGARSISTLAKKWGQKTQSELKDAYKNIAQYQRKLNLENLSAERKSALKSEILKEKKRVGSLEARSKEELKSLQRRIQTQKKAVKEFERFKDKAGKGRSKAFTDDLKGVLASISGKDAKGLVRSLAGAGHKGAKGASGLAKKGAAKGGGGMSTQAMAGVGTALAGLGAALGAFIAVAAVLAVIVKVLVDADAHVKEFNKSLLSAGSAGDFMLGKTHQLEGAMKNVREATKNWGLDFRATQKEQLAILTSLNQAGFTYKEIAVDVLDGKKSMENYQKATLTALTYSRLFGVSTSEIAGEMGKLAFAMGNNLDAVQEQFAGLYESAVSSGFGVKRFYTMVLQATSGMAFYNIRIAEAAELAKQLSKVLGEDVAGSLIQTLNKGFTAEGMTQRMKRVILTGRGAMKKIFQKSAENTADAFKDTFGKNIRDNKGVQAAFRDAKINLSGDPKSMVSELQKLGINEQTALLARIRSQGGEAGDAMARDLGKLIGVSEGAKGGVDNMVRNMDKLDMGGVLVAQMKAANSLGFGPLHKQTAMQLAATENATGVSGEQLEQLERASQLFEGQFMEIKRLKSAVDLGAVGAADANEQMRKKFGVMMDADGKIKKASMKVDENGVKTWEATGDVLKDQYDLMQSQPDLMKESMEAAVDEQTKLARGMARNTEAMSKFMEMGMTMLLERIAGSTEWIADMLSHLPGMGGMFGEGERSLTDSEKKQKGIAMENITSDQTNNTRMSTEVSDEISALKAQLKNTDKASLKHEALTLKVAKKEKDLKDLEYGAKRLRSEYSAVSATHTGTGEDELDAAQLRDKSRGLRAGKKAYSDVYGEEALAEKEKEASSSTGNGIRAIQDWGRGKQLRGLTFDTQKASIKKAGVNADALPEALLKKLIKGESISEDEMNEGKKALMEDSLRSALNKEIHTPEESAKAMAVEDARLDKIMVGKEKGEIAKAMAKENALAAKRLGAMDLIQKLGIKESNRPGALAELMRGGNVSKGTRAAFDAHPELAGSGAYDQFKPSPLTAKKVTPPMKDFMVRGNKVIPFSSDDDIIGAQKGGAMDKFTGGGGANITINVNGGDQEKVYRTVRSALKSAGLLNPSG